MTRLRSDLWCAAFVRRHNDLGNVCVVSRKGDAIAGQVWIEHDHLDGSISLYVPAPAAAQPASESDWVFQTRFDRSDPTPVYDRIHQEANFDPDFWVIAVETRDRDLGIMIAQDPNELSGLNPS